MTVETQADKSMMLITVKSALQNSCQLQLTPSNTKV